MHTENPTFDFLIVLGFKVIGVLYYQMKISYVHSWWLRVYSTQSPSLSNIVTTCLLLARNFLFFKFPLI